MEILAHRALRGPNYYARSPVTYMLLDIGELEDQPSDAIEGLPERIKQAIPSLIEHRCSPGVRGGFFQRLDRGTWAGHIVEHIAIELQCLAGMDVTYGKTRETTTRGVYAVVYKHRDEECGLLAGRVAVEILEALIADNPVDIEASVLELKHLRDRNMWGPSTAGIVEEAASRGIPVKRLNAHSHVLLGQGVAQKHIQASMTGETTALGIRIAADKSWTKSLLEEAGIAVPRGAMARSYDDAARIARRIGYPVVVKPLDANHGRGITTDIQSEEELRTAYNAAKAHHEDVVVETFLTGRDHRLLVIGGTLVAAARRDPAHVIGDGEHTVQQLIDAVNADPRRGVGHENVLTAIHVDDNSMRMLKLQEMTLGSTPAAGQEVVLKSTANLSTGGTATDVTDEVHPDVRFMAERVARIVGLDIMGIDIVAENLQSPLDEVGGGIVEVNAGPGLRMHLHPTHGTPREVGKPIVDLMFGAEDDGRIPTVAVTGTNGKTTTVRLIAHCIKYAGGRVGIASTGSVEVENQVILRGDYSGPMGAQTVLREPTVSHAVLEVARGGIIRRGMGVDWVDVGVLLNVGRDHIGEGDIHDEEDLLRLKATVPDAADTAVLNADDPLVVTLLPKMRRKVILFSMNSALPVLQEHLDQDPENVVVCLHDGMVQLRRGGSQFDVVPAADIPINLAGRASFNVQNALAATAACYAIGLSEEDARNGLTTFNPTTGQNPGRLNLLEVNGMSVVLDFGHNVPALEALDEVLPHLKHDPNGRVLRVAYLAGNRLEEDLRQVGAALTTVCDELWLSDPDPRGRPEGEAPGLLAEGALGAGMPADHVHVNPDEWANIEAALAAGKPGDLLVFQCDANARLVAHLHTLQEAA